MARTREDIREYQRAYREANKEQLRASAAARRETLKETKRLYDLRYREKNRDRILMRRGRYRASRRVDLADKQRERTHRLRRTGFTQELFDEAVRLQCGVCAICCCDLGALKRRNVHADHCHVMHAPRGVLCSNCNLGLGHFKDDVARLERAIGYLNNPTVKGEA